METAEKTIEATEEVGAVSMSPSASLLDNQELSHAIVQTFNLLGRCTPNGPEQTRLREHWWALLSERERRLSSASDEGRQTAQKEDRHVE